MQKIKDKMKIIPTNELNKRAANSNFVTNT